MPSGVATHFVDVLASDGRAATRRWLAFLLVGILFGVPAWLMAEWIGITLHVVAMAAGILGGVLAARMRTRRLEESIRGTWTQWMRFAASAETVAEIHRKVRGRSSRNIPYVYAGVLFVVWGLEATVLVLSFVGDAGLAVVVPILVLNALLPGGLVGFGTVMSAWFRDFRSSVQEMVRSGEIGMWGVV